MAQMTEKVTFRVIKPLVSMLKVSTESSLSSQVRRVADSQLPDTDNLVSIFQT